MPIRPTPTMPMVSMAVSLFSRFLFRFHWTHRPPSNQPRIRRQAEEVAADRFVDRELRLRLLRHRMHVAKAALERIALEHRGGASGKIDGLGDLPRGLRRVDRRHTQPDALI